MDRLINFEDVLIEPIFSTVRSRKDVNLSSDFLGLKLALPILNSNMDTIASPELCTALGNYGCLGTLHRFWSIEENVAAFVKSIQAKTNKFICPAVSIGLGELELERAKRLYGVGANIFILDVAHAANIAVVEMYNELVKLYPDCKFIVGDFGTGAEIQEFLRRINRIPDALKV